MKLKTTLMAVLLGSSLLATAQQTATKNQEPTPYTMSRVRANVWQYAGPTSVGDGTVTMVVQFTSAIKLKLTRTFVSTAEPNCTHVHTYTGDFKWNR